MLKSTEDSGFRFGKLQNVRHWNLITSVMSGNLLESDRGIVLLTNYYLYRSMKRKINLPEMLMILQCPHLSGATLAGASLVAAGLLRIGSGSSLSLRCCINDIIFS